MGIDMKEQPHAFPFAKGDPETHGMTLRDWFAGQALSNPAICTGQDKDYNLQRWFGERGGITSWQIAAAQALEFADAMIAERNRS
jgi:hypothetical protein